MANTYGQNYQHVIFATKFRKAAIDEHFREELERYITGILQNRANKGKLPKNKGDRHKLIAIYSMPDHVHILIGLKPWDALSDLVALIKQESTNFINAKGFTAEHFAWQAGYSYFSHAHSELDKVVKYIRNQPEHHRIRTTTEEIKDALTRTGVDFEEKYLFSWVDG
jgi:putative transposase